MNRREGSNCPTFCSKYTGGCTGLRAGPVGHLGGWVAFCSTGAPLGLAAGSGGVAPTFNGLSHAGINPANTTPNSVAARRLGTVTLAPIPADRSRCLGALNATGRNRELYEDSITNVNRLDVFQWTKALQPDAPESLHLIAVRYGVPPPPPPRASP